MIFTANNLEKKFKAGGCSAADFVNPIKTAEGQIGSIPDVHERRTIIRIRAPRQTSAMQQQPTRLAGNFCRERPKPDLEWANRCRSAASLDRTLVQRAAFSSTPRPMCAAKLDIMK